MTYFLVKYLEIESNGDMREYPNHTGREGVYMLFDNLRYKKGLV